MVVDRLSAFHIGSVIDVTGGQLISSLSLRYPSTWLGKLRNIRQTAIEGRRYISLKRCEMYCVRLSIFTSLCCCIVQLFGAGRL